MPHQRSKRGKINQLGRAIKHVKHLSLNEQRQKAIDILLDESFYEPLKRERISQTSYILKIPHERGEEPNTIDVLKGEVIQYGYDTSCLLSII